MKSASIIALFLLCVSSTGCTTRNWYEAIRANQRDACEREFADTERARCLARTEDDYDTYSRKRQAVLNERPEEN